ncbi:MAG: septum site-determining protein MinD [Candidatus Eremiobacteraeota bacterium]|nr:septum site-determining protein MinD [Candidatus Eremiobacteraeota bacterium]
MLRAFDTATEPDPAPEAATVRGKAIVITSGKGGVGKTTTTANVGNSRAAMGKRVVLVDADVGLRNLDIVLGLESRVKHHLLDVLEEKATLDEALVRDKRNETLFLLAAAQTREKEDVVTAQMQALVADLCGRFDFVLIDCPAGIEMGFKNAVAGAHHAIVVCTPEVSAVRDADRVVGLLPNDWRPELIINRLRPHMVKKGKMLSVDDVNGILRLPLLGVIADEPGVIVASNKGEPLALDPNSEIGAAYRAIAAKLAGQNVAAPTVRQPSTGFFSKLGAFFGGRA